MATYNGSDKRLAYLFENGGGGGGTTVIANPSGQATDDLEKLQVGETIYDIPTGGSSTLAGLNDVNLSSPTDGQVLKYDETNDEWVNGYGGSDGINLYLNTIYSETEEKIGYWVDGRPLYQKTLNLTAPSNSAETIIYTGPSNIDIKKIEGYILLSSGANIQHVPLNIDIGSVYVWTIVGASAAYTILQKVTQAQYYDLPEIVTVQYTKTTDTPEVPQRGNVIYLPTIYSEEEREVGVWEDGKPLYQLSVVLSSQTIINSNAWYTTSISNANIEKIPYARGMNDEGTSFPLMANCDATGSGVNYVQIGNPRAAAIGVKEFVIQYTKTTDTAGSGSWTPSGAPAVHYSTDEQVVGTWFDGKTLYQKTIYYAGGTAGGLYTIPHNISNLGDVISCTGFCRDSTGDNPHMIIPRMAPDNANIGFTAINETNMLLSYATVWQARIVDVYITIQYTKSS